MTEHRAVPTTAAPNAPTSAERGLDGHRYAAAHDMACAVASDVVLVYDPGAAPPTPLHRRLLDRGRPRRHPFRSVHPLGDGLDLVVAAGPGAPVAAVTIELLAVFGARRVVSVGVAAGDHRTSLGSVLVVDGAPDPDGLLPCPDGEPRPRCGPLFDRLAAGADGLATAHTTLWPFRLDATAFPPERTGPTVVEMEARALFAVGDRLRLDVQAVVATSDRYDEGGRWTLGETSDTTAARDRALTMAANALVSTRAGTDDTERSNSGRERR